MTTATQTHLPAAKAKLFASLDPRDRRLLLWVLALITVVALVVTLFTPPQDDNNPTPSTFASTSHGALAAYLALAQSGYSIERWERPLAELTGSAGSHTVLILADPFPASVESARPTVKKLLDLGVHILATGPTGAMLLPGQQMEPRPPRLTPDCAATPEGFGPLANSGTVHIRPIAVWKADRPDQHAEYTCNAEAVVVRYAAGNGEVIWWADSMPMENANILRDGDLALLLNSIGPPAGTRVVWDESLHTEPPSLWSHAAGTPVHLLWMQLALVALLLVLSYSRRRGPLLPDPVLQRDTPLEFVHSLGALYDKANATNTAVRIAYDRFRLLLGRQPGNEPGSSIAHTTQEIVSVVNARLGRAPAELQQQILACEEAAYQSEPMPPRRALTLIQSLWSYERELKPAVTTSANKQTTTH